MWIVPMRIEKNRNQRKNISVKTRFRNTSIRNYANIMNFHGEESLIAADLSEDQTNVRYLQ
jgi:hypothetical protein